MSRALRVVATLAVTALCTAYILWKIDVRDAAEIVAGASPAWFAASVAIMLLTTIPMAWRWQRLLAAQDVGERLRWLNRSYLVSYAAGQILPTSIGGDAMRIYETARRHPGRGGTAAGSVVLERALGGTATLTLGAVGFLLAIGRYDVGAYLWIEFVFVLATVAAAVVLFSRTLRRPLARLVPLLRPLRLERPVRAVYEGIHAYRAWPSLLVFVFALTVAVQAVRVLAIWGAGEAVGVDLSPRIYYVMGPLFFLVMLVPFTINGLAVREAFFVSFLGGVGVDPDTAFAAGFLFFLVTVALAVPGGAILAWEGLRGSRSRTVADA